MTYDDRPLIVHVFLYFSDIAECNSIPCLNGAVCNDAVNGYTCVCLAGYSGVHCETGNQVLN